MGGVGLKPQDVVLGLELASFARDRGWTQPDLARELHVSASEVNHGLKRLAVSHLYNPRERRIVRASAASLAAIEKVARAIGAGPRVVFVGGTLPALFLLEAGADVRATKRGLRLRDRKHAR
jgi:hypothetical protein